MIGKARLLLSLALVGVALPLRETPAQTPERVAVPAAIAATAAPNPLPGLPQPPDVPASLLAPPVEPEHGPSLPGPYFEHDPRLDPPLLPQPGWFAGVELDIVDPHVKNKVSNTVTLGGNPVNVTGFSGVLDWTVAPQFTIGYRLSEGFGEFRLSYRYLGSSGNTNILALDGISNLHSKLDLHKLDLDYASREWSLWDCCWDMKWFFGMRFTSIDFDSYVSEPVSVAAAGGGIAAEDARNRYDGGGPHVGLELDRKLGDSGLALFVRTDCWFGLGRIAQTVEATSAFANPDGTLPQGLAVEKRSQTVVQFTVQAGVRWEPGWHHTQLFAGYIYDYWWNVGRDSDTLFSRGEMNDQGLFLQAEFNY